MDETPLYQQIAESIRQEILYGRLQPGDTLPAVRALAQKWDCTPGTVQRAFQELARQGVIESRRGRRSRVSALPNEGNRQLHLAELIHKTESFLLEVLAAGYSSQEVEGAVRLALDRWRALSEQSTPAPERTLRFAGSHDLALSAIAARFPAITGGFQLQTVFSGSLGGLIALARGEAELAGSHLWDETEDSYNLSTVRRLLPGQQTILITLAQRRLGLITPPGNPAGARDLHDLARLRFVNRQRGAGTRVWLDAQLRRLDIDPRTLAGFEVEVLTHGDVAQQVATAQADVGLGIEAAALAYKLGFVPLTTERYDLVMSGEIYQHPAVQALAQWLAGEEAKGIIAGLGGYETAETGHIRL